MVLIFNGRNSQIPLIIPNLGGDFAATVSLDREQFMIVAIEIIEQLINPYLFLRECAKLLKPDGLLSVTLLNVELISSRITFYIPVV